MDFDDIYDYSLNNSSFTLTNCDLMHCTLALRHNRDRGKDDNDTPQSYQHTTNQQQIVTVNQFISENKNADEQTETHDIVGNYEDSESSEDWATPAADCEYISEDDGDVYDVDGAIEIASKYIFIRDLFDCIHCYLLHQYDFGYKIHKNIREKALQNEMSEDLLSCKDNVFSFLKNIINDKKKVLHKMSRFNNHSKFTIEDSPNTDEEGMFMDALYQELHTQGSSITTVHRFFEDEEYDTDALYDDFSGTSVNDVKVTTSNILNMLSSNVNTHIHQYWFECKLSQDSFSSGYAFYYWDFYEKLDDAKQKDEVWNFNTHHGYHDNVHKLYIQHKYENIKDEMINNKIYCLSVEVFRVFLYKAMKYIEDDTARGMKAASQIDRVLHYGIKGGTKIKVSNLLSVILYTDTNELQNAFTKTFRKIKLFESIASVKRRNSEFSIWARILRETVEYFGYAGQKKYFDGRDFVVNKHRLCGPFFCGMSTVMVMNDFNIRLCGPTSTSRSKEVTTRFSGRHGIIIQLNNNGDENGARLRAFDCQWISAHSGEEEFLFIGGLYKIKIEAITDVATADNYCDFFGALFLFDCMVSGTHLFGGLADESNIKITSLIYSALEKLMKHALKGNNFRNEYPKYVNDTFAAFINNKKHIVLNLPELYSQYYLSKKIKNTKHQHKRLSSLFMNTLQMTSIQSEYDNLFQPILLKLFRNAKNLTIFSSTRRGRTFMPFNLSTLLSLINDLVSPAVGITITIKANQTMKSQWQYDGSKLGEWVIFKETIKEKSLRTAAPLLGDKNRDRNQFTYNSRERKGKIIEMDKHFFSIICGNDRILKVRTNSEYLRDDPEYKDSRTPTKSWLTKQYRNLPFHSHNWYLQHKNTVNVFGQKEDCLILKFGQKGEESNEYEAKNMESISNKVLCSYDCNWTATDDSILILHTKIEDNTFLQGTDICKANTYSESWKICSNGSVYRNNKKRLSELGESDLLEKKITGKNMKKLKSYLQKMNVNIREIDSTNNYTYFGAFSHEFVKAVENLNEVDFDIVKALSSFMIIELGFRFPIRYDEVDYKRKLKKMYIQNESILTCNLRR